MSLKKEIKLISVKKIWKQKDIREKRNKIDSYRKKK